MCAAAGPVGEGEHPGAASRLQPSHLLGPLQQLHPERRRAVHLPAARIQVKRRLLPSVSDTFRGTPLTLCPVYPGTGC